MIYATFSSVSRPLFCRAGQCASREETSPGPATRASGKIARYLGEWPPDIDRGVRYVIFFYSRTCPHCQELFALHFAGGAPAPTTIVAIPETKAGFAKTGQLPMECPGCEALELPVGTDWIITTPIVVALDGGGIGICYGVKRWLDSCNWLIENDFLP